MDDSDIGGWPDASSVMNKVFSVVWNTSLRCWVVASELASKKTKSGSAGQRKQGVNPLLALKEIASAECARGGFGSDCWMV